MSLIPQLERELYAVAERHAAPPRRGRPLVPLAIGEAAIDDARDPRSARLRHRRVLVLSGAAVVCAVVVLALSWSRPEHPPRPLTAIAEARAALKPGGRVLYMRVRLNLPGSTTPAAVTEQWSTDEPTRWRYVHRLRNGTVEEMGYGGGVSWIYFPRDGLLNRTTGYTDKAPQTPMPSILALGGDAAPNLQELLAKGKLTDKGEVREGDRTVRRLERDDPYRTIVYDVDPRTFAPVGGWIAQSPSSTDRVTFTVERFAHLAITPANLRLLAVTPKSSDRVTTLSKEQYTRGLERQRRLLARCRAKRLTTATCRWPPWPFPMPHR